MAVPHTQSGEVVDVLPLGERLHETTTRTLVKTDDLLVVRMVLPAGKIVEEHIAPGQIVVQCIEGVIEFHAHGEPRVLEAGHLMHLLAGEPHSLRAVTDASMLLMIILKR